MLMSNTKFSDLWHGSMLAAVTACMAVGLVAVAHGATPDAPRSVTVSYGDLDLASAQGFNTLYARIAAAARQVCAPGAVGTRDLGAFAAERACVNRAIGNAVRDVQGTRVASSLAGRHDQG
jgi:UrcA family protein